VALLEVRGLEVRYGGVTAVRGVDLTVEEGRVEVVLGSNGAGKTSSLRSISGLQRQSAGSIQWDGRDISKWPAYRVARVGLVLVPEGRRVFAPLTVEQNLLLGAYTNRDKQRRQDVLERVYDLFPVLVERKSGRAGLLSGGEQQMLAFGRAMMAEPKVILADEPSMGLSPAMVDVVMGSIAQIAKTGIGVLMVEQNANAALEVADSAVVIERGQIVLRGSAAEVRSHPDVVRAFLGESANSPEPVSPRPA
jgi:branched-chain amino acid transport system ATP-binding protein